MDNDLFKAKVQELLMLLASAPPAAAALPTSSSVSAPPAAATLPASSSVSAYASPIHPLNPFANYNVGSLPPTLIPPSLVQPTLDNPWQSFPSPSNSSNFYGSSTVSDHLKRIEMATLPKESRLMGYFYDKSNNWDLFSRKLVSMFKLLQLWNGDSPEDGPLPSCSVDLLKNNMVDSLQTKYDRHTTAPSLWFALLEDYHGQSRLGRGAILQEATDVKLTLDMEVNMTVHEKLVQHLLRSWGPFMDTVQVARLLFVKQLPDFYADIRLEAQSTDVAFETVCSKLNAKWIDHKLKTANQPGRVHMTLGSKDICPIHKKPTPCFGCNPCSKCSSGKKHWTHHLENSELCKRNWTTPQLNASSSTPVYSPPPTAPPFTTGKVNMVITPDSLGKVNAVDAPLTDLTVLHPDSGSTTHVLGNKAPFDAYSSLPPGSHLEAANGTPMPIEGWGHSALTGPNGLSIPLNNAYHVPTSSANLLSVSQWDQEGYSSVFTHGRFFLIPSHRFGTSLQWFQSTAGIIGSLHEGLYAIHVKSSGANETGTGEGNQSVLPDTSADPPQPAQGNSLENHNVCYFAVKKNRSSKTWHDTLNHLSASRLAQASVMVDGLTIDGTKSFCTCLSCAAGKSKERPYTSSEHNPTRRGEVIVADTWFASDEDADDNKYYVVFIDVYTMHSWVYFYATKDEISSITVRFLKQIQNETGLGVAFFCPDQEGGFVSNDVETYCASVGTQIQ